MTRPEPLQLSRPPFIAPEARTGVEPHERVGEILVRLGELDAHAAPAVVAHQNQTRQLFGEAAVSLRLVGAPAVARALAEQALVVPAPGTLERLSTELVVARDPFGREAERVRDLRARLLLGTTAEARRGRGRVIAIVSPQVGEGRSWLAANLSASFAQRSRRVVLIDADLRRPKVAMLLGIPPRSPGLTNLIKGAPLEKCIHHIPELNLNVLPFGESLENPLDLIASPRFPQALNGLRQSYDMIVIDTPPVELVSDALLIARLADGLIYVVKAGETPVAMIQRGLDRIQGTGVTLLGVALNSHDFEKAGRYYGDTSAHTRYSYQTRPAA